MDVSAVSPETSACLPLFPLQVAFVDVAPCPDGDLVDLLRLHGYGPNWLPQWSWRVPGSLVEGFRSEGVMALDILFILWVRSCRSSLYSSVARSLALVVC